MIAYDTYFFAGKGVPEQAVEAALKAVWEGGDQLLPSSAENCTRPF